MTGTQKFVLLIIIPITGVTLCCCLLFGWAFVDTTLRQYGVLPTWTPKPTSSPTATMTPTSTKPPTARPTATETPTVRPTATERLSAIPTVPTATPSHTPTSIPASTPEVTPTPEREAALVVDVVDGDTIKVELDGRLYTIRYIGIDCPETRDPARPVEWMGPEATEANRRLVGGQIVYLERDVSETDRYGRLLRYVFLADGTFVNAELVRLGYAQVSTYPPDVRYQSLFLEMEREAREAGRGLWGPTPVPSPTPTMTSVPPTSTPVPITPSPTLPATASPAPPSPGQVIIAFIYYDGQVPRVESDEYVVIRNTGGSPVNLAGWRLNADDPGQDFWFPDFELQPGQECRVYTNEDHPEWCGFNFGSGSALWANSGECGHLYDQNSVEVSTYCY